MAITKEKATECLGRLTLLKRFPVDSHAMREIARVLSEVCKNDASATRAVDSILGAYDEWPGPASFRAACWETQRPKRSSAGTDPYAEWVPSWEVDHEAKQEQPD